MGRVAAEAVGCGHALCMRFMAVVALWDAAMGRTVAFQALQLLVPGPTVAQHLQGFHVAGTAGCRGDTAAEGGRHGAVSLMAVAALIGGHILRVRRMALAATGDAAVLAFVAVDALQQVVPCLALTKYVKNPFVTSGAICRGDISCERDRKRLVGLVALVAILFGHAGFMGFVAIGARREVAVTTFMA